MAPFISVIIPTYNRRTVVKRALDSVMRQTFSDYECVVVDDGSDDGTDTLVRRDYTDFGYVRLPVNRGVAAARNAGARNARGEWLAFLDSDDEWHPDKLARQVTWIRSHAAYRIVQTREIWIRRGVRVNPPATHEKRADTIFDESLQRCMVTPSSVMIERALFEETGGFKESLPACEDYDLWLRICCRWPVGLIDAHLLTRYGGHADQLSATVPILDRFRIRSIMDLLSAGILTPHQERRARRVLVRKALIVARGYNKRERKREYERYRRIAEEYR